MNTLTDQDGRSMFIILWQKRKIQSFFSISKIKPGSNQMSSIVLSAHVAKPTLGKQKETPQYERQNTRTSLTTPNRPVASQDTQPTHTHGTLGASSRKIIEGLLIAYQS